MDLKKEIIKKIEEAKTRPQKYVISSTRLKNHAYPYEIQNILKELGYEYKYREIDTNYDTKQYYNFDHYYNSNGDILIHQWNGFYGYNSFDYINMNNL